MCAIFAKVTNATTAFVSPSATACPVRAVWGWDEPQACVFDGALCRPRGAAIAQELAAKGAGRAIHLLGNGAQTKALCFKASQRDAFFGL